ncbi:MAG: prolipoprotein diacylglyceryl transferase [Candidatus Andersenbacteria bacterium]|nr:prolipoprotein diacylglyceryl transferase [bacterium]MDZ4225410.1 prolipoprotein diacylglyceryl transferase [Candidatus Andersenbacteria bacterium]
MIMINFFPERAVAVDLWGWPVRWYGVFYVAAFILAWRLLPKLARRRGFNLNGEQLTQVLAWTAAGVLIGGRLGYVFLYNWLYFAARPAEILALWHGGMAAHGGLIGAGIGLWLAANALRINFWSLLDVVVIPAALGLALGRLGNFLNQELYGTVTVLPWGVRVPFDNFFHHPVQIYAALANIVIALICYWLFSRKNLRPGQVAAVFLLTYGAQRFGLEYWRYQEWSYILGLTRGQFYSLPVILAGVWLWFRKPAVNST